MNLKLQLQATLDKQKKITRENPVCELSKDLY